MASEWDIDDSFSELSVAGKGRGVLKENGINGGRSGRGGGGSGGFGNRRFQDRNDDENGDGFGSRPFRKRDDNENEDGFGRRPFRKRDDGDNDNVDEDGVVKKPPVTYIPPDPTQDENEMYNSGLNTGINFDKYDSVKIKITQQDGEEIPVEKAAESFATLRLRPFLLDIVKKCGYKKPTPVQKATIPLIMAGRDVMACAQTGSGKTAAFILPIVNMLLEQHPEELTSGCAPQVLIVSPTRELAIQIWEECRKFICGSHLRTAICYGGTKVGHQLAQLTGEKNIIVATPGRLVDFVERGRINFSRIQFVVLDEGDRMLDMGFKPEVEKIMNHSSMSPKEKRQTLMFSATFPKNVQQMAREFLRRNYVFAAIGTVGVACADVDQQVLEVSRFPAKMDKLLELLRTDPCKTIVFASTKRTADMISIRLCEEKFPSTSIHGDREQQQRETALRDFRCGKAKVLVATSVAARGLDIRNVARVVVFDIPNNIDEYVHQIGRTGRLGNRGVAISFYDASKDSQLASSLIGMIEASGQEVPAFLEGFSGAGDYGGDDFGGVDLRQNAAAAYDNNEEW